MQKYNKQYEISQQQTVQQYKRSSYVSVSMEVRCLSPAWIVWNCNKIYDLITSDLFHIAAYGKTVDKQTQTSCKAR